MGKRGFQQRPVAQEALERAAARHDDFVRIVLPKVRRSAGRRFRNFRSDWREEALQEAYCLAWKIFLSCIVRGKEPLTMIGSIVKFAVTGVFYYRSINGLAPATDMFSRRAQERGRFKVITVGSTGFHRFLHMM